MKQFIGFKNSLAIYVDEYVIMQKGLKRIKSEFGLLRSFPVKTSSNSTIMIEADSHEDAIKHYLDSLQS